MKKKAFLEISGDDTANNISCCVNNKSFFQKGFCKIVKIIYMRKYRHLAKSYVIPKFRFGI